MESCTAGSGRPVSSPAASLTKTEVSQRVPTEDLVPEKKTFLYRWVCLDGRGYQRPEVPDLKISEGLLPVPHGSQNDILGCYTPNICLSLEMQNEGSVDGGLPDD